MNTTNINTGVNSLSAAKATEIENGVILYEFNSEAETETAVIECIEKGVKFNTTGRRSLVIHQPAPTVADEYAVTYGGEAIATTTSEAEAHEIAKGEAEAESTIIDVLRKSDNTVIAVYDFTETATTPETETTTNTETPMTTTDTTDNVTTAIANELNARNDKSAWGKAVTAYALELVETLDNWDKQPESVAELREMMLNGAADWSTYSWGGSSLIYNQDIATRCCTPSELKRVTNKNGLRDMANAGEHWLDVQARALYQAANLVCNIANSYFKHETQSNNRPGGGGIHRRQGVDHQASYNARCYALLFILSI